MTCSQCSATNATYMSNAGEPLCATCFQEGEVGEQEMRAHEERAGGFLQRRQVRLAGRNVIGGGALAIAGIACLAVAVTRQPFDSDFVVVGGIGLAIGAFLLVSGWRRA